MFALGVHFAVLVKISFLCESGFASPIPTYKRTVICMGAQMVQNVLPLLEYFVTTCKNTPNPTNLSIGALVFVPHHSYLLLDVEVLSNLV